jgi:hypothetical protein
MITFCEFLDNQVVRAYANQVARNTEAHPLKRPKA